MSKWTALGSPNFCLHRGDGQYVYADQSLADHLNQLETDKAELMSLIANLLTMAEAAGGEWEWGTNQMQAVNQAHQLLARINP